MELRDPSPGVPETPYVATVPGLLSWASSRFASSDLVVSPTQRLTYAQVDEASRSLAGRLVSAGVGKGTPVALFMPNGPAWIVSWLAITRIGATAVALSTFYRSPELKAALRHSDARVLLFGDGADLVEVVREALPTMPDTVCTLYLEEVPALRHVWCEGPAPTWATSLDDLPNTVPTRVASALEDEVHPSDRLAVVYTSGTTSAPKGVVHTHGSLVRHAANLAQFTSTATYSKTFTSSPFFWVGGLTWSLLRHMHVGGTVLCSQKMDTTAILDLLELERPDRIAGWGLVDRLRADPTFASRDFSWLPSLNVVRSLGGKQPGLGMTETAGPHVIPTADSVAQPPDAAGCLVPGLEHRIVDTESGADATPGTDGEILVRGYSLMEGIHKVERRDCFDPDGWLHTGDVGRIVHGQLFFQGRAGNLIKTDGANVYPSEIEDLLSRHPAVTEAIVMGVPDGLRGEVVAAVLVAASEESVLDIEELLQGLRKHLSGYKVPKFVVQLKAAEVPRLGTGKADIRTLAKSVAAARDAAAHRV